MKVLLIGASLLALTVPGIANAQTSADPTGAPVAGEVAQGRYLARLIHHGLPVGGAGGGDHGSAWRMVAVA